MLAYLDGFYWCQASVSDAAQKGVLSFKQPISHIRLLGVSPLSLVLLNQRGSTCDKAGLHWVHQGDPKREQAGVGLRFTELWLMNWHPSALGACLERVRSEQRWRECLLFCHFCGTSGCGGQGGRSSCCECNCMVIDQMRVWDLYDSIWVL